MFKNPPREFGIYPIIHDAIMNYNHVIDDRELIKPILSILEDLKEIGVNAIWLQLNV